ncbi:hypothetical protein VT930_20150 [Mycobacterium sherrisii]|nr:hypothetical protein [Mycobacterium sherrisii]MEC4765391.1 hypothetical protein [Mycobacterium sherrisii]
MSTTALNPLGLSSLIGTGKFPAALLTTTSSRPKVANTCSTTAVTSSGRRTSQLP